MTDYLLLVSFLVVLALFLWETKCWVSVIAVCMLALGNACNQIAVLSNAGKMPVFVPQHDSVLILSVLASPHHTVGDVSTRFAFLTDRIDIPQIGHIVSIGDVAIVVSLTLLFFYACYGVVRFLITTSKGGASIKKHFRMSYPVCISALLATYLALFFQYVLNK